MPQQSKFPFTHDDIAQRAYEIWQRRGCPQGGDGNEDWNAAVAELKAETAADGRFARGPIVKLWRRLRSRAAL